MKDIHLIEIDSELGAGTRGSSLGIGALKVTAYNKKSSFFADYESTKIDTLNHLLWEKENTPKAKRIDGIVEIYNRTCDEVAEVLVENKFPVVLSGDHSTAGGTISGIKKAFPNKRLGVVWVDAHADLHTPYTTPSGNVHGMPLATALNADNLDSQINDICDETKQGWEALKNCGSSNKLNKEDLVFIAVRDTEKPEDDFIARNNIKVIKVEDVRNTSGTDAAKDALDYLNECDIIYISFDVDSMDCDLISYGTGTPVKNGLTDLEAKDILNTLIQSEKVVCFETVEINPCLDNNTNRMAEVAFDIVENTINTFAKK